jgi:hypothetical protein
MTERKVDVAEEAFQAAAKRFTDSAAPEDMRRLIVKSAASLDDVRKVVVELMLKYEASGKYPKAVKWLQEFSGGICYYSNILDVFVQHHPEYVSLAWGAMKFLFIVSIDPLQRRRVEPFRLKVLTVVRPVETQLTNAQGVLNHEKTVKLLAKSLAQIAECLPHVQLASRLYPTPQMTKAVEELYSYILKFLMRAYDWYNEGKIRHIIHSITQPPELRYKDLLEDIRASSRSIDQVAVAASQAELREMHIKLFMIVSKLEHSEAKVDDLVAKMACKHARNIQLHKNASD